MTAYLVAFGRRSLMIAAVYWIVAEGRVVAPPLAAVMILAAVAISLALLPAGRVRLRILSLLSFALWFFVAAVRGGIDVAFRAVSPSLPLVPGFIEFHTRLTNSAAQVFFANTISLLPGTLSVALQEDRLSIHALDIEQPLHERLRDLEDRVAAVFASP